MKRKVETVRSTLKRIRLKKNETMYGQITFGLGTIDFEIYEMEGKMLFTAIAIPANELVRLLDAEVFTYFISENGIKIAIEMPQKSYFVEV